MRFHKFFSKTVTVEHFKNISVPRTFPQEQERLKVMVDADSDSEVQFSETETESEPEMDFNSIQKPKPTFPIVNRLNRQWGDDCSYWKFWTVWEPRFLQVFYSMSQLEDGLTIIWKDSTTFPDFINETFSSFKVDSSFLPLSTFCDGVARFAMVRLDFEENIDPYLPLSQMVEIKGTEIIFYKQKLSIRLRPIYLLACKGLADIMRAVCRKSDILIMSGTYKRANDKADFKSYLLLNFDNDQGQLQIIRATFPYFRDIFMIESITPTQKYDFRFIYFVQGENGKPRKQIIRHRDFKWRSNYKNSFQEKNNPFEDFSSPIQYDQDECEIYTNIFRYMILPAKQKFSGDLSEDFSLKDSPVFFSYKPTIYRERNKRYVDFPKATKYRTPSRDLIPKSKSKFGQYVCNIFLRLLVLGIVGLLFFAFFNAFFVTSLPFDGKGKPCSKLNNIKNPPNVNGESDKNYQIVTIMKSALNSFLNWIAETCGWTCMIANEFHTSLLSLMDKLLQKSILALSYF